MHPRGDHLLRDVSSLLSDSVSCCLSSASSVYLRMLLSRRGTLVQCCIGEISRSVSCSRRQRRSCSHHCKKPSHDSHVAVWCYIMSSLSPEHFCENGIIIIIIKNAVMISLWFYIMSSLSPENFCENGMTTKPPFMISLWFYVMFLCHLSIVE